MTGILKQTLAERAETAATPALDLDAIIDAGRGRVRRRRGLAAGGVGAVAAATAAVLAIAPLSVGPNGNGVRTAEAAHSVFERRLPTYADGTEIVYGGQVISTAPHRIDSYVVTADGIVFASEQAVYVTDGTRTQQVGTIDDDESHRRLVGGYASPYAAWVDENSGRPQFVVFDTSNDSEVLRSETRSASSIGPEVVSIDGDVAYGHDSRGVVALDIATGDSTVVMPDSGSYLINSVVAGVFTVETEDERLPGPGAGSGLTYAGLGGSLSADATYTADEHDDVVSVYDVASGDDVTPAHRQHAFVLFGSWLDDDAFTLYGLTEDQLEQPTDTWSFDLLRCSVAAGQCEIEDRAIGALPQAPDGARPLVGDTD